MENGPTQIKPIMKGSLRMILSMVKEMKFLRMAISMRDSIMREKRLVGCMWRLLLGRKKRLRLRSKKKLRMKKKLKKSKLRPLDPG